MPAGANEFIQDHMDRLKNKKARREQTNGWAASARPMPTAKPKAKKLSKAQVKKAKLGYDIPS